MRQLDHVTMENITPVDYLHTTSKIYGADSETLEFVFGLIKPFFPVKKKKDENNVEVILLDPFHNASVKDLSGGQRRMLAIAAALFQNSSLLLLDEPLSGLDSVSSVKVIELLSFIAQENAVTVFMTLHQPSNEILDAMDTIMVLEKGKVVFDSRIDSIKQSNANRVSTADFVHELLSDVEQTKKSLLVNSQEGEKGIQEEHKDEPSLMLANSSPLVLTKMKSTRIGPAKHLGTPRTNPPSSRKLKRMASVKKKKKLDSYSQTLRLWQVQPLVRRINLEHRMKPQEFLILPIAYLLIAGWGSIDSTSPVLCKYSHPNNFQRNSFAIHGTYISSSFPDCPIPTDLYFIVAFLLAIVYLCAAVQANQARVVVNWDVLSAHLWDLEDKRISPLSFLIASSFQMYYVPLITIPVSLALAYAALGWNWAAFLPSALFIILTTIVWLQVGRTLSAKASHFRVVAALFNVVVFAGFVLSGTLVNPSKVPVGVVWIMYLSPFFWGYAGTLLSMFQYAVELGEQPCQSLAACIVYNPGFMAHATGIPSVTTASMAMYVLIGMALILALIEYILLCQKVVQRNDYTTLTDDGEEEQEETDEIIEMQYQSTRSNKEYVIQRRQSSVMSLQADPSLK